MIRIKLNQQINLQRNVTFSFFFLFSAMPCSLQNLSSPQHRQNFPGIPKCNLYIREGNGTPLQYSCLENPMDRGTWQAAVHEIAKNRTRLSNFTFTFHFHALETEMATHSSVPAWRIPGTEEPGRRLSMGSQRVRHD